MTLLLIANSFYIVKYLCVVTGLEARHAARARRV